MPKFLDFVNELKRKYPNNSYPGEELIRYQVDIYALEAYFASQGGSTVGSMLCENHPNPPDPYLEISWLVVDPKAKNESIGSKLISSAKSRHDKIRLFAENFGNPKETIGAKKASRQEALIRYYAQMGFRPEIPLQENRLRKKGSALSMVWEKGK